LVGVHSLFALCRTRPGGEESHLTGRVEVVSIGLHFSVLICSRAPRIPKLWQKGFRGRGAERSQVNSC
jgi:hypothetical protein